MGLVLLFAFVIWGDLAYALMQGIIPGIMPLKFQAWGASNLPHGLFTSSIPALLSAVLIRIRLHRSPAPTPDCRLPGDPRPHIMAGILILRHMERGHDPMFDHDMDMLRQPWNLENEYHATRQIDNIASGAFGGGMFFLHL